MVENRSLLSINNQLGYLVGVDIGATSIDLALADVCGEILQRRSEPADVRNSPDTLLGRCCELICEMVMAQGGHPEKILGIGVGVPGPVEFQQRCAGCSSTDASLGTLSHP